MKLLLLCAATAILSAVFVLLVVAGMIDGDKKGPASKGPASVRIARSQAPALPPAQPAYARSFQAILDAARPKGAKRIIVKDCRRGRIGNEHFCTWLASDGKCRAGFITEDPSLGTVPHEVGRVPFRPSRCTTAHVLRSLKTATWLS